MATLQEVAEWVEGIYQLEVTDPVMGGADGIDNRQAKELANRTLFLKNALQNLIDNPIALSSAINSSATDVAANSLAVKKAYDKAVEALNASVSVIYDPTKRYLAGEIVFICDDPNQTHIGNWYEAYHPDGCQGKDPRDPANRPDGWTNTDPAAPYYWLKHGKFIRHGTVGTIELWESENLPQNRIPRLAVPLNASKFWRLAEVHANYVSGGNIILPDDVRGQFLRFKGATTGVDAGRVINTLQGDAIRNIAGYSGFSHGYNPGGPFFTDSGPHIPPSVASWSYANSAYATVSKFDASRVVPTAAENRPVNTSKLAAIPF